MLGISFAPNLTFQKTEPEMIRSTGRKWRLSALFICQITALSLICNPLLVAPLQAQDSQNPPQSTVEGTAKEDDDDVVPLTESAEQMRKRLAEEKRKLESIENKKLGVNKQVKELDRERARLNKLLIDYAKRIQQSEANLTNLESKLENLHKKEDIIRKSMLQRRDSIADMLGLLQRMGRNPPPIMATHRDDALKMVRSGMLMATLLPKLTKQAETLKSDLVNLVALKNNIAKQSERLRIQNAEMESDQRRVNELLNEKNTRILTHNRELQEFEQRAQSHSKSVASLGDLITKVDAEIKKKTELKAYEKQLVKDQKIALEKYGKKAAVELTPDDKKNLAFIDPGRIKPALPFAKVKHTLSLPVRGTQLRGFGDQTKYGNNSKGISIETRHNAQITSPSDGWIAYAGKFRSYGQLLIINAGGGYHILLAGLDRIDVKTSQFVLAGEPIGIMQQDGNPGETNKKDGKKTKQPVLYIEFRKDGRPIDPSPWWSGGQSASN